MAFVTSSTWCPGMRQRDGTSDSALRSRTGWTCSAERPETRETPKPRFSSPAISRRQVLAGLVAGVASATVLGTDSMPVRADDEITTSSGLKYKVVKEGTGAKVEIGDLVLLRFRGTYNNFVFDDLYVTDNPYMCRAGSGVMTKGLEEALLLMSVGDKLELTIPGDLAFGSKGRRASAGKPSIPPNATVSYVVEVVGIPGKDEELIESIDDEFEV